MSYIYKIQYKNILLQRDITGCTYVQYNSN